MDPESVVTAAAIAATLTQFLYGLRVRRHARDAERAATRLAAELERQRHEATHDWLTGLPNRRAFDRSGAELLRDNPGTLACVLADIDQFKWLNDRWGHAAGDQVLTEVARRLGGFVADAGFVVRGRVARLAGDEFVALLEPTPAHQRRLEPLCELLAQTLATRASVDGATIEVTVAVGLAPVEPATDLGDALRRADAAMYRAKSRPTRAAVYDPALDGGGTDSGDLRPARPGIAATVAAATPMWHPSLPGRSPRWS